MVWLLLSSLTGIDEDFNGEVPFLRLAFQAQSRNVADHDRLAEVEVEVRRLRKELEASQKA